MFIGALLKGDRRHAEARFWVERARMGTLEEMEKLLAGMTTGVKVRLAKNQFISLRREKVEERIVACRP